MLCAYSRAGDTGERAGDSMRGSAAVEVCPSVRRTVAKTAGSSVESVVTLVGCNKSCTVAFRVSVVVYAWAGFCKVSVPLGDSSNSDTGARV